MSEDSLLAGAEPTPSEEVAAPTEAEPEMWSLAEGITGEGDKPDWFKDTKYKSVADQAKAYAGLESKLGGFTGAPEAYEVSMPEGMEGEFLDGDPMMEEFQSMSKEMGLNQEAFTKLHHMYLKNETNISETDRETELAAIGENAESRLQNINDFAKANLSEEDYNGVLSATTTAAGVKAFEAVIALTRTPKIPTEMNEASTGMTREEIRAQMSDPRYQSDPAFRAKVSKDYERLLGKGPKSTVVG